MEPLSLYEQEVPREGSHYSPSELEPSTSSPSLFPTYQPPVAVPLDASPGPLYLLPSSASPQSSIAANSPNASPPPSSPLHPPLLPNLAQEALERLGARGESAAAEDDGDFRPAKKKKKKEENAGEAEEEVRTYLYPSSPPLPPPPPPSPSLPHSFTSSPSLLFVPPSPSSVATDLLHML